ncbi:MAG: hypothetical protein HYR88_18195 [Verrucomicrobia bacterium]|nr:hypothetical protein [Verrucomicrobiota bacterium]
MTDVHANRPMPSRGRIILAFAVALAADAIQFPLAAGMLFGVTLPPLAVADVGVDLVAMIATTSLIGFHWVLLPGFILEAIPGIDLAPTWTGCVAFALWRRRREAADAKPVAGAVSSRDPNPPIDV